MDLSFGEKMKRIDDEKGNLEESHANTEAATGYWHLEHYWHEKMFFDCLHKGIGFRKLEDAVIWAFF